MQQSKANGQKTPQEKITTPVGTNLQIVDDDDLSEDDARDPATSERRYLDADSPLNDILPLLLIENPRRILANRGAM